MISLDPGIKGSGIAHFEGKVLQAAAYVPNASKKTASIGQRMFHMADDLVGWVDMAESVQHEVELVVERPRIYRQIPGDPDDLMVLAEIGACLAGFFCTAPIQYRPHDWKDSIEPIEMTRRVRERLSTKEIEAVVLPDNTCSACRTNRITAGDCLKPSSCLAHNVWDAVGIGLHHLGRLKRKRVISR